MIILLSASQHQQTAATGKPMRWQDLSFPELTDARQRVAQVLARESSRPYATGTLHVRPDLAVEVARNVHLDESPGIEVGRLYCGDVFTALDLASLSPSAARRAAQWVVVVSALYGALRVRDRVAPYHLSMGSPLPELAPLARFWRGPLANPLLRAAGDGVVVDCRSTPYAAVWAPRAHLAQRWLAIRVDGTTQESKRMRGTVVREVLEWGREPRTAGELGMAIAARFAGRLSRAPGPAGNAVVTVPGRDLTQMARVVDELDLNSPVRPHSQ